MVVNLRDGRNQMEQNDRDQVEMLLDQCADRSEELYAVLEFGKMREAGLSVFESVEAVLEDLYGTE